MAFFFTLFLFIAMTILSEVLKPKPKNENARPAALGDFNFPTATEGRVVPLVWGTVKMEGPNVVWYGDLIQKAIRKKMKTGLFSSTTVTTGYKYYIGIQFALCRGPVDEIRRIWIGEKEVSTTILTGDGSISIDKPELFGGTELGNGGVVGTVSWKKGSDTQIVNSYLAPFQQQGGDSPAYRGTAYCTFEGGYVGTATQIKPWAFEIRRLPVGPGAVGAKAVNSSADANPAYVLYEILTDSEWGLGFPVADIDTTAFNAVADTLVTEGNGFSFVLDGTREINDLMDEVQRQIDGVVFLDQQTGKWTIKLARDDFNPLTIPVLNETNLKEVKDFSRGSWNDTTNYVTLEFVDRSRDYFKTFSLAQDLANYRIQGVNNKANIVMPGVKDKTLANSIVWRELRMLSFPLAKATVLVNREFWDVYPTDAIKWTCASLGFADLIMRVSRINLGELAEGQIELTLVQDVFSTETPSFGDPPPTGWSPPSNTLVPIPAAQSEIIEAPLAFSIRDPDPMSNSLPFRVWTAARNQGDGAVEYDIRTRFGGNFTIERVVNQFMLIGELTNAITESVTDATITVTPTPDSQAIILDEFDGVEADVLGDDLTQLVLVGDEFMLVRDAAANASNVDLQNTYRGVLDSVPAAHNSGTEVWLLFVGGGIGNRSFANTNTVDVRLVTRAPDDELSESSATNVQVTMANRHLRPSPPIGSNINGAGAYVAGPHSLDANGTFDTAGLLISFIRRDYTEYQENARHIGGDAAPSNATTYYRIRVYDASSLPATYLYVSTYNAGTASLTALRTKILRYTLGVVPTDIRIDVETQHTIAAANYTALQAMSFTFSVNSAMLAADFNLGVLTTLAVSNIYSAPDTGTYVFTIGQANTGGPIEARINGGGWATVITTGATTGNLTGVTATDTIEVRANGLTLGTPPDQTFLEVLAPVSTNDAYAVFIT